MKVVNLSDDLNKDLDNIHLEVLNMHAFFGCSIERDENRARGLLPVKSNRKNFTAYYFSDMEWGQMLPMNI